MDSKDLEIRIKFVPIPIPACETCGNAIYPNQPRFFLYQKFYHGKCGYNN